jgi:hypothetical protein
MFFHKKVGDKFLIYRAERNTKSESKVNPSHPLGK